MMTQTMVSPGVLTRLIMMVQLSLDAGLTVMPLLAKFLNNLATQSMDLTPETHASSHSRSMELHTTIVQTGTSMMHIMVWLGVLLRRIIMATILEDKATMDSVVPAGALHSATAAVEEAKSKLQTEHLRPQYHQKLPWSTLAKLVTVIDLILPLSY